MHRISNEDVQSSQAGRGLKAIRSIDSPRFVRFGNTAALALAVAGMVLVTATATTAFAVPSSNRVKVEYVPPKNPAHQKIYERLKEDRALEKLQKFLSP